ANFVTLHSMSRPKGGFMGTRGLHLAVISLLLLGVMVAGCAMRPATTAASGAGRSAPAPASGAPGSASASNPSGAARPVPSDVVAVRDLQDIHFDFDRYDIRPRSEERRVGREGEHGWPGEIY